MTCFTCYSSDLGSCGFAHKSRGRAQACIDVQRRKYTEIGRIITEVDSRAVIGHGAFFVNTTVKERVREWSGERNITPVFDRQHGRGSRAANEADGKCGSSAASLAANEAAAASSESASGKGLKQMAADAMTQGEGEQEQGESKQAPTPMSTEEQVDALKDDKDDVNDKAEAAIKEAMEAIADQKRCGNSDADNKDSDSKDSDSDAKQGDKGEDGSPTDPASSFIDIDALAKAVAKILSPEFRKIAEEVAENTGVDTSELEEGLTKLLAKHLPQYTTESIEKMVDEKVARLSPNEFILKFRDNNGEIRKTKTIKGRVHCEFANVMRAAQMREPALLIGPTGCGKSTLGEQVAESLVSEKYPDGFPFATISCSEGMSEGQLTGRLVPIGEAGKFEYVPASFVTAYEEGGVFLWDEIDGMDANVGIVLHSAIANGYLTLPNRVGNQVAYQHADFVLIAAANTFGRGANRQYVGRNALDEATLDRFRAHTFELNYDPILEDQLVPCRELLKLGRNFREVIDKHKLRRVISMRVLIKLNDVLDFDDTYSVRDCASMMTKGWTADELSKVQSYVDACSTKETVAV